MPLDLPSTCSACAAPLAGDQRYCLECGERRGPRRLPAQPAEPAIQERAGARAEEPAAGAGARVPGPRVAALLTLAMLVGGIALGAASGDRTASSIAAAGKRWIVVGAPAPAPAPAAVAAAPDPTEPVDAAPPVDDVALADELALPAADGELPAGDGTYGLDDGGTAPADDSGDTEPGDTGPAPAPTPIPTAPPALPPVGHVWVVALADRPLSTTFGPGAEDPWFREVLGRQGVLLTNYHATSSGTPANGIALLSGQGANPATEGDCSAPETITPGTVKGDLAQLRGTGCLYPATVPTLPEQLTGAGKSWKAYLEEAVPGTPPASSCQATRSARNPFAFFEALTQDAQCPQRIVGAGALAADLADPAATPTFSYVVPNACHDGSAAPCTPGATAGLPAASAWLQPVLSQILASQAYRDDGMVVIVADRSGPDGPGADTSARTGSLAPAGGGLVGALVLSRWVTPGQQVATGYDHFALLRSLQDLLGLPRLGQAGAPGLKGFGPKVFGAWTPPAA